MKCNLVSCKSDIINTLNSDYGFLESDIENGTNDYSCLKAGRLDLIKKEIRFVNWHYDDLVSMCGSVDVNMDSHGYTFNHPKYGKMKYHPRKNSMYSFKAKKWKKNFGLKWIRDEICKYKNGDCL